MVESRSKKRRRRWLRRLCAVGILLVLAWLGSSYGVAYRLTHRRQPPFAEPVPIVSWATFEELRLRTEDGESLGAWYCAPAGDANNRNAVRPPVVMLLHGIGGNRSSMLGPARWLLEEGYGVLLVTLRAHGDSSGQRNDFGYSSRLDVRAGIEFLHGRDPQRPIVVWGQSLGAAAALYAAAESPIQSVILECPYRDLYTATRNRMELHLPPVLSLVAYAGVVAVSPLVIPWQTPVSLVDAADRVPPGVRVLVLAGGADRYAKPEEARELAAHLGPRARLEVFEGAGHGGLENADAVRYRRTILEFVREASGPR